MNTSMWSRGSSPHTRGALQGLLPRVIRVGIIPAYAGSTGPSPLLKSQSRDHPRIRGEHSRATVSTCSRTGSSPHTRGARACFRQPSPAPGIIPAYAGSTPYTRSMTFPARDHPRIRGEHPYLSLSCFITSGSSPHTRGARALGARQGAPEGIIPAYAGSTCPGCAARRARGDHPRIRGEHKPPQQPALQYGGSSPHTRGAQHALLALVVVPGIIPAYAGSTAPPPRSPPCGRDHPRIRGEHYSPSGGTVNQLGSFPHTRGARGRRSIACCPLGIIPAYAGSTAAEAAPVVRAWDHPRIRGEHLPCTCCSRFAWGSSPHTRGALDFVRHRPLVLGIIPAYAGSTPALARNRGAARDHPRIRGEHGGRRS